MNMREGRRNGGEKKRKYYEHKFACEYAYAFECVICVRASCVV